MAPPAKRDAIKEISSKIASYRLGADVKEILIFFLVQFTSLQSNQNAVPSLEEKVGVQECSYKDKITALEARVASLEEKNQSLLTDQKSSIKTLQANVDANEQYERRDTLILSGPNLPTGAMNENCTEIVRNLLRQPLRLNLSPTDITTAQRLWKKRQHTVYKRRI